MTEKELATAKYLKTDIPDPPPQDNLTAELIELFFFIARSRRVESGQSGGSFFPLTVRDVTEVVEIHEAPLRRQHFDPIIFSLDMIHLEYMNSKK